MKDSLSVGGCFVLWSSEAFGKILHTMPSASQKKDDKGWVCERGLCESESVDRGVRYSCCFHVSGHHWIGHSDQVMEQQTSRDRSTRTFSRAQLLQLQAAQALRSIL